MNQVNGIAADLRGNLYLADTYNNRIRKIGPDGIITTVAGIAPKGYDENGHPIGGFSGDGGPATKATLNYPMDVAVDAHGNLYLSDAKNNRIRKVDSRGIITTVAGSGPANGPIQVNFSGDGGPATQARLSFPEGITLDDRGNLYIADWLNDVVRKVDARGIISTVAGITPDKVTREDRIVPPKLETPVRRSATQTFLFSPADVAVDSAGNLFVSAGNGNRVYKVTPNGMLSRIAGNEKQAFTGDDRPASLSSLHYPRGLAIDPQGNLLIADTGNYRVRKVWGVAAPGLIAGRPFPEILPPAIR
ncbi:MAG: hypothetical protein KY468_17605 [Armatimonadetes bacterium]|nr:hypothetical protein [Armatimonadota bacterium]